MATPHLATVSGPLDVRARPASNQLEPGTRFGAYRILGLLGEGGMGQVYQAVQGTLERIVALKVMRPELAADPQFAERFLREARAAASVCHQHVVMIFDAGEHEGRLYMAFQFVTGGDLDAVLGRRGPFAPTEALLLIAHCCEGLQAIHEVGLVHRDIKPHNLFIDAQGRPKLGDFGLARQALGADRMTVTGVGMGTPSYMAPEQAQGLADIDIRADIHALGGTLYTMLTGHPPYTGLTPWMVVNAVCNDPAPDPRSVRPDLPEPIAAMVLRCLAKRREDRYQSPEDLRADALQVAAILGGKTPLVAPTLPRFQSTSDHSWWRRSWPWTLGGAVLIGGLPLVLRPLLALNDHVRLTSWSDPAWWAGWLAASTIVTLLVASLTSPIAATRRGQLAPWLLASGGFGTAVAATTWALLSALDASNSAWMSLPPILGSLTMLGWLGWSARTWWQRMGTLAGRSLSLAFIASASGLLITLICHLAIAQRPITLTRDEAPGPWESVKRAFTGEKNEPTPAIKRATGAASALSWLAPQTCVLLIPMLVLRRRRN